jgi:hypothetical protein
MDALSVSSTSASTTPCDATARPMSSTATGAATTSTVPTGSAPAMRANPNPWDPDHAVFNATKDELKGCRNSRSLSVLLVALCRSAGPRHRAVGRREERQIQALDRTQPGLPLKKGRLGTMTHGTVPRHCSPSSTSSIARPSAATCSVIVISSFDFSTTSRRRFRSVRSSTSFSTTMRLTNTPTFAPGLIATPPGAPVRLTDGRRRSHLLDVCVAAMPALLASAFRRQALQFNAVVSIAAKIAPVRFGARAPIHTGRAVRTCRRRI